MTLLFSLWLFGLSLLTACYTAETTHKDDSADPTNSGTTSDDADSASGEERGRDAPSDTATVSDSRDTDSDGSADTETVQVPDTGTQTLPGTDTDSETSLCGNGVLDPGEECEDGNPLKDDQCNDDCQIDSTYLAHCGDGNLDTDEGCDDGNRSSGDGCSESCCIESWDPLCYPPYPCRCGDGMLQAGEECDDGNMKDGDGCSYCRIEPQGTCPNGVLDEHEECDDGNTNDNDNCDSLCRRHPCVYIVICGDGVVQGTEECDDGNINDGDGCPSNCASIEPGYICPVPGHPCALLPDGGVDAGCGNGIVEPDRGEACDDGVNAGGYGECAPGCVFGPYCGDGIVQSDYEECDNPNDNENNPCTKSCKMILLPSVS